MASPLQKRTALATWCAAALVGACVLALAALLSLPAMVPFPGHGADFAAQSQDPLSLVGKMPQRILWPLLAHAAGLVGITPPMVSQLCSGALLAVVFWFCRQRGLAVVDAVLVTLAVGATGAVQLYQTMTCHSDTLNWILLLLLVHHAGRFAVFWPLVLLSALSHEMVFFLSPWLVYLRVQHGRVLRREVLAVCAVAGIYWLWLQLVRSVGGGHGLSAAYYFQENWLVWGTLGLWVLWLMLLVVEFGPLLAVVAWAWRTGGLAADFGGRAGPWLYSGCVLSMMAFAYDVQRFACHAFLPLVLASIRFLAAGRRRALFASLLVLGIGTYAAMHWIPGQAGGWPYERAAGLILEQGAHAPGTRHRFFTHVLPLVWPGALWFAAGGAAIVGLGFWLARRRPTPPVQRGPDGCFTIRNASP